MDRKTEQELREMIRKFLDLNPTDEQLEAFYINEVLPHDKRSIVEIMTRHLPHSNGVDCWACGKKIDGLDTRYIDSWPRCTSIWTTHLDDIEIPEDFYDSTYHNDVCPSITDESGRCQIWIHDQDTWLDMTSQLPMFKYQVQAHHREVVYGEFYDETVDTSTNDWNEALKAIETWRKTARKKVEVKSPDLGEYLDLFAFDEWGAYQGVVKVIDEPYLVFAPMNQDGTPDMDNFGATEVFEDVSSDGSMLAENEFLAKINEFFGTEFTINDFPLMGGE